MERSCVNGEEAGKISHLKAWRDVTKTTGEQMAHHVPGSINRAPCHRIQRYNLLSLGGYGGSKC